MYKHVNISYRKFFLKAFNCKFKYKHCINTILTVFKKRVSCLILFIVEHNENKEQNNYVVGTVQGFHT